MGRFDNFTLTDGTRGCIDKVNGNFYTPCPPLPSIHDKPYTNIGLGMIGSGYGGTLGAPIQERKVTPTVIVSGMSKFRGFTGSEKATLKSSGIYLGASVLGAVIGHVVTKKKENKYKGLLVGLGIGLATGAVVNSITK